jgi:hypothetical protein
VRDRLWHWAWPAYLVGAGLGFGVLEWTAYRRGTHPTLSRELRRWTGCARHQWTALVFVALGGWLAAHLMLLKELEEV